MDLQLEGKSAIITGASKGLGLATAKALVAEGCRVCICARGREGLDRAAAELTSIGGDGMVLAVATDVTTAQGAARVVESALEAFGGIDILINNVATAKGAGILDTPDNVWQDAVDQTLFPAIRMSRLVVPHMKQQGGGSIVMVASIWGRESGGRMTYNAVKAAEISLAKSMAQQLAVDNIRVNSVAPGSILFPGGSWDQRQKADPDGIAEFVRRELPFGRFGRADEVGAVIAFLVSPRASWISGSCVPVDGCQSRSLI
ncbi:MAG: SDR family oxidoreductase [Vicinamibacterales bacterium]|nr:SDR family oxidoreductase [Vicinamibacterales bacterium]